MHRLCDYKTIVFDCDGVVLNSNIIKTQAFYNTALPYGVESAQSLVAYHTANGGISRYKKFEIFLNKLLPVGASKPSLDLLLDSYASEVRDGLLTCEISDNLPKLRGQTLHSRWLIVSGGDQNELREIFEIRGLSDLFDGGIFGSPDTKDEILIRELSNHNIILPAIFIGDTRYDHVVASKHNLDFIFLSQWSEFHEWSDYCSRYSISHISSLSDLMQ